MQRNKLCRGTSETRRQMPFRCLLQYQSATPFHYVTRLSSMEYLADLHKCNIKNGPNRKIWLLNVFKKGKEGGKGGWRKGRKGGKVCLGDKIFAGLRPVDTATCVKTDRRPANNACNQEICTSAALIALSTGESPSTDRSSRNNNGGCAMNLGSVPW